jgi:hypothetical protein
VKLTDDDLRALGAWAADCAQRVLPLFEAKAPDDTRPREAIEGIREFACGGKRTANLRKLAMAALAAAREVGDPVATAAARSAGVAASIAYTHPLATLDQAKHILAPPAYAALAAGDGEIRFAAEHATDAVRAVLAQMPARSDGKTGMEALFYKVDAALRGGSASRSSSGTVRRPTSRPRTPRRPPGRRRTRSRRATSA